jgi:hypothetical protein
MKLREVGILILVALVIGCGGGGGGSGDAGTPPGVPEPPGGGGGPPGGGNGPPGGGGSTGTGTAQIVFPWQKSGAMGSSLVVRGKAADPDGVSAVRVNGVAAVLTSVPATGVNATKSALVSRVQASSGAELSSTDSSTAVTWSLEVDLQTGVNDVVVTVEDGTGDVTDSADHAAISYYEVPSPFISDRDDPRLLGWSSTLTPSNYVSRFVAFDYASGQQTVYPEFYDIGIATCFRSHTDDFVYLTIAGEDPAGEYLWELRRFNLGTRTTHLVAAIAPEQINPGPGFSTGPLLLQLACSGVHDSIYLLANYWEDGDAVKSRILQVDPAGSVSILTETDPEESPLWLAYKFALADDALISIRELNAVAPLSHISLQDGSRTDLAAIEVGGLAMAAALQQGLVYVTTFDGVDEVRLTDPPTKGNISPVEPTDPLNFSQADSIKLDLVNNRVIVGDSDIGVLIAVDLATGQRSELLSRKIGAGPPLITPRRLALTAAGTSAYVVDDGSNAPERLFEIDLTSGDKRLVGQINKDGINGSITGLALDEEGGYLYLTRYAGDVLLRVDLATEVVDEIWLGGDGLIEQTEDLLFDATNQRLLVADSGTDAIVAVDVATFQKQLISRAGERGEGEAFTTLASLTMAAHGTSLYAADQATDQILRVDLETGDREVLETTCPLGSNETLSQVLYDASTDELLILSDGIFAFDLETSVCTQISPALSTLDIRLTADGKILSAGFNAVTQIDRQSGGVVIVSK